jgi:hypothetical protein
VGGWVGGWVACLCNPAWVDQLRTAVECVDVLSSACTAANAWPNSLNGHCLGVVVSTEDSVHISPLRPVQQRHPPLHQQHGCKYFTSSWAVLSIGALALRARPRAHKARILPMIPLGRRRSRPDPWERRGASAPLSQLCAHRLWLPATSTACAKHCILVTG